MALTWHDPSTIVLGKDGARLTVHLPWDLDEFCEVTRFLADRGWDFDRDADDPMALDTLGPLPARTWPA